MGITMPAPIPVSKPNLTTLSDLLCGDEARVLRVLRAFRGVAHDDLIELDEATRAGDGVSVRKVASRLAMACHLVGEGDTGAQLDAISRSGSSAAIDPVLTQQIARGRAGLIASIARITVWVDAIDGHPSD
jgi:hypothetical protein